MNELLNFLNTDAGREILLNYEDYHICLALFFAVPSLVVAWSGFYCFFFTSDEAPNIKNILKFRFISSIFAILGTFSFCYNINAYCNFKALAIEDLIRDLSKFYF